MVNFQFDRWAHVRRAGKVVAWGLVICLPLVATAVRLWAAGQVAAPSAPQVQRPKAAMRGLATDPESRSGACGRGQAHFTWRSPT